MATLHVAGKELDITDVPSRSFCQGYWWNCPTNLEFLNKFSSNFPLQQVFLASVCSKSQANYIRDFHIAYQAIISGRVTATTYKRESIWSKWCRYIHEFEVGVDPYLEKEDFNSIICSVTGFVARVRTGYYSRRAQI